MSESEAAVLNTDREYNTGDSSNHANPIAAASILGSSKPTSADSIKSPELLKESKKWKKNKLKVDENSCTVINHLAIKIELKHNSESYIKTKVEDPFPALPNGNINLNNLDSFICNLCGVKFSTELDLTLHTKKDHAASSKQQPKAVRPLKVLKERMQYYCFSCNGRTFLSRSSLHRHIAQHVTLPEVRLSRLKDIEVNRSESPVLITSGRPQVALKRVTASCHARSPLKFLFKLTGDPTSKDSFKVVKANIGPKEGVEDISEIIGENRGTLELSAYDTLKKEESNAQQVTITESPRAESEDSLRLVLEEDEKEFTEGRTAGEGVSEMVEASHEQCSVPFVEESVPNSPKDTTNCRETEPNVGATKCIEEGIMRPMKNGEGDMDKIQSNSPSVIRSPTELSQLVHEKSGLSSTNADECDDLGPEFIPIERLDQGTAAQIIEKNSRDDAFNSSLSQGKESETNILCEACGESVPGDQTALEDHCLCRGHYKCPICSVACASTDALAVHTKETHQNQEAASQPTEKKKKTGSSLRSVRRKHQDQMSKDTSIELSSDISLPSPPSSDNSNSTPMPSLSTKTSENSQSGFNVRVSDVTQQISKPADRRTSPSSQQATSSPPVTSQVASEYSAAVRMSPHQNTQARPTRMPETMPPPPLMRQPIRNAESQARGGGNVNMNEPMQPPPALYKMPTTSHGMTNSQLGLPAATMSNMAYPRGIPASGYQTDPPSSAASNIAAAMNARYQTMHRPYPAPGQAPSYAPYPPSMQMQQAQMMQQQRFQMGPPPPYSAQMHHPQQGPRVPGIPQEAYLTNSQQAYNQSLLKAHLEQARMQGLPQPSAMLQSMQNLQQEHYQQQQLQKQLFQQPPLPQIMQPQQQEQNQSQTPQAGQKRKSVGGNPAGLRYHHQNALSTQQSLQNQLQQSSGTPAKQRRVRDNIGIPSKQTDSDCEIIAVQQRGEGVPVIQSIQGANASTASTTSGNDGANLGTLTVGTSQASPESTIHLTDSITLSVRQPPASNSSSTAGSRGHNASAVASILATRGITVTPASGSIQQPRTNSVQQRSRPSPPPNRGPAISPPQQVNAQQASLNNAISISHSSRQLAQPSSDGFAVPAPVGPVQRQAPRQQVPADRPPRPPTVDLTDENAAHSNAVAQQHAAAQQHSAATVCQCRLCDKQFPSMEALHNHMQAIHQTRNYFRCTICNTKHSSQHALANHVKRVHKFSGNTNPAELVIPLVDLRNAASVNRLNTLGIRHVISLSQLGLNSDSGLFCIPIMSLEPSGQQRTNTIGGLMAMGTTAVLPVGPVKSLPSVSAQSPQQTVPAANAPPPLAPIRPHQPNQYIQPPHQLPPR